jgi:SNF2 family DNA or RNA helicase
MNFEPREYQTAIIDWINSNSRTAIFASMGSGKTVSTLTAITAMSLIEEIFPVLIIAPLRVATTTWPDEIKKWKHTEHLTCNQLCGTKKEKEKLLNNDTNIVTTNFESLPWLVDELGSDWPFKCVIVDESTRLKGFRLRQGSTRAKALAKVAHTKIKRMILLTGTPAPNGLKDLWGQMWFIDQGCLLEKSFSKFLARWFIEDKTRFSVTPIKGAQEEIQELIKTVCLTVDASDYFDLDVPIVNKLLLPLPLSALKEYKRMEKNFYIELEENGIEASTVAVKMNKCAQIANGAIYLEDQSWKSLHDEKLIALDSIISEANGMPILVTYYFKSDLDRLLAYFPYGRALVNAEKDIKEWNDGQIPLLFIHPKSAGHGLNLQYGSNILVFFSLNWNLEEHLQVIERIGPVRQKQAGLNRPVFLYYLLAKDTIDIDMMDRLSTKKSVQEILLTAMNRYRRANNASE